MFDKISGINEFNNQGKVNENSTTMDHTDETSLHNENALFVNNLTRKSKCKFFEKRKMK